MTSAGCSEQSGDWLAILEQVLGPAVVIGEGCGGVDTQDAVQRCQHVLHSDRTADDALAASVGGADHLAGLQPTSRNPEKTCFRPVAAAIGRHIADARRSAELT